MEFKYALSNKRLEVIKTTFIWVKDQFQVVSLASEEH